MVARARQWLAWAARPPYRSKPGELRQVWRIKRSGGVDAKAYLAGNPDVAAAGIDPVLHYVTHGARERRSPGSSLSVPDAGGSRAGAMKSDWDARARAGAMHFIATDRLDWDEASFSESGRGAVEELIAGDLDRICAGRDPAGMRVLEIGCGIGRMTEHLADVFGEVHGVDVSGEMIARGRERLAHRGDVHLTETSGADLAFFGDAFFDFAFSFIVFQHVPAKEIVLSNFREVRRTLKPGGTFKFQVQGFPLDNSDGSADTWVGVSFDPAELAAAADEAGFEVIGCEGAGTQMLWSWWRAR